MLFTVVYLIFSLWILILGKLYFRNLDNPENPNLNLDCTDYICEIHLVTWLYCIALLVVVDQFTPVYGRWPSFRASTSFRVFAAYLTISQPI